MTRIDFYILPQPTLDARLDFACRLAETIHRKGYRLHIHTEDEAMGREFDERLWNFRFDAFVPHALLGEAGEPPAPVTIGWQDTPEPGIEALLNLHPQIPAWFSRFERVAEIINQHQGILNAKRECWQTYKSRGYSVQAHHIEG
ncbi:DNA polymerase III subunit chi [Kushneria phosphatilytica]|uniref:DNA polymerase III subunit chi n=1 Tax=Kushneria phosphatilytica TaxID=657387 RepID=UPI0008DAA34E|nr:DNA polymerase III subunit chi [Kushneria phosphatilytica]OHV07727.1 DNA polymerase III subunit chi [Kushneria phosphatilytica]